MSRLLVFCLCLLMCLVLHSDTPFGAWQAVFQQLLHLTKGTYHLMPVFTLANRNLIHHVDPNENRKIIEEKIGALDKEEREQLTKMLPSAGTFLNSNFSAGKEDAFDQTVQITLLLKYVMASSGLVWGGVEWNIETGTHDGIIRTNKPTDTYTRTHAQVNSNNGKSGCAHFCFGRRAILG